MKKRYPVVTLCGSTRFRKEFEQTQKELTLKGYIVISVGLFGHSGDNEVWEGMSEDALTDTKLMLDDMHKRKIDMAESIFVVNPGGYIGSSTWSEIRYAKMCEKKIDSLVPIEALWIEEEVEKAIERAELVSWKNQDAVIHQGIYANTGDIPFIVVGKDKIFDPWWSNDEYDGEPLSGHGDRQEPFEKYGKQKMAAFVEDVIRYEKVRSESLV